MYKLSHSVRPVGCYAWYTVPCGSVFDAQDYASKIGVDLSEFDQNDIKAAQDAAGHLNEGEVLDIWHIDPIVVEAQEAIARSISHNEVAVLDDNEELRNTLLYYCDDYAENGTEIEYWGEDEGSEWRVRLIGGQS